jgi:hypothetical protein
MSSLADDLSIEDLTNSDLWTLDDSKDFSVGNRLPMENSEEVDQELTDEDLEEEMPSRDYEPFDWFHEMGPIYDV